MARTASIKRDTLETKISIELSLDGTGRYDIATGCGFLDHMLTLFARHGRFDLTVRCVGDLHVDAHHTTEDVGIALGEAFSEALGDKRGITRYADIILPMDEALILAAVDVSGRSHLTYDVALPTERVGDFDTELGREFWLGFVRTADMTLHLRELSGDNSHHILEACFKAVARILSCAVSIDDRFANEIPSTKGVL